MPPFIVGNEYAFTANFSRKHKVVLLQTWFAAINKRHEQLSEKTEGVVGILLQRGLRKCDSSQQLTMVTYTLCSASQIQATSAIIRSLKSGSSSRRSSSVDEFPSFLPKEVKKIKDPFARKLATRIERLPVQISSFQSPIMSSCVRPLMHNETNPVVLLHGFDSSCLEWRCTYPLLEEAGLEIWSVDVLGWGFSDLERLPLCDVASKREHLYQFWKSYIKNPMTLVGPSLGAAVAIDFAFNYPEAVTKLVLIDASVYAEGTGNLAKLPRTIAYAGVSLLKSTPLRLLANFLAFDGISFDTRLDWTNVGRLHCLLPWWEETTINFMTSGGYNVRNQIKKVKQETLIIWGENDQIVSSKLATQLHHELPNATLHRVPDCGHLPHVEKPDYVANLITDFVKVYFALQH